MRHPCGTGLERRLGRPGMCTHPRRRVSAWEEEKRQTRRSHVSVAQALPTRMTAGMMDGHEMDAIGVSWASCVVAGRPQPLAGGGSLLDRDGQR